MQSCIHARVRFCMRAQLLAGLQGCVCAGATASVGSCGRAYMDADTKATAVACADTDRHLRADVRAHGCACRGRVA
eukprot:4749945-Alexandrium_andersonii.AAC.1